MAIPVYKPLRMKRVVIGSFGVAMLVATAYLGVTAILNVRVASAKTEATPSMPSSKMDRPRDHARRSKALAATGCALVGGGLLMWLRNKNEEDVKP